MTSTIDLGTAAPARSYADLTEFGVAAVVIDVDEVESVSCTAPLTAVVASAMEMAGVVPPDEAIGDVPVTEPTFVPAKSYAALTAVGVAARTLLVVEVESLSCTAPLTAVVASAMDTVIAVDPLVLIGEVPATVATFAAPSSNAALTAVGVAARTLDVVEVESLSCTAPTTAVVAAAMEMTGVAPPEDAIGAVAVTAVTPPPAAAHFSPVASAESAVRR